MMSTRWAVDIPTYQCSLRYRAHRTVGSHSALSLALYAGHVIDISEKRKLLLSGVFMYVSAAFVLFLLSLQFTAKHLTHHHVALCIYVVIGCTGIVRAFAGPSFNVLLALIVPRQALQNAITWNQGAWLTASVMGHAMGGFSYLLGVHYAIVKPGMAFAVLFY